MGKNGFFSHVGTGLKAIVGSIIHSLVIVILFFITTLFLGDLETLSIGLIFLLFFIALIISVFLLGWIYNSFWGWN